MSIKNILQEYCQKKSYKLPTYLTTLLETDKQNIQKWVSTCCIDLVSSSSKSSNKTKIVATSTNKKNAESKAAKEMCKILNIPIPKIYQETTSTQNEDDKEHISHRNSSDSDENPKRIPPPKKIRDISTHNSSKTKDVHHKLINSKTSASVNSTTNKKKINTRKNQESSNDSSGSDGSDSEVELFFGKKEKIIKKPDIKKPDIKKPDIKKPDIKKPDIRRKPSNNSDDSDEETTSKTKSDTHTNKKKDQLSVSQTTKSKIYHIFVDLDNLNISEELIRKNNKHTFLIFMSKNGTHNTDKFKDIKNCQVILPNIVGKDISDHLLTWHVCKLYTISDLNNIKINCIVVTKDKSGQAPANFSGGQLVCSIKELEDVLGAE